jgi:DNA-binding FrmR family transcriptional regulator
VTMATDPVRSLPSEENKKLLDRLARVEGQLRGVQRMIQQDAECEAVAQQLAAARGALNKAFAELIACALERHLISLRCEGSEVHKDLSHIVSLLSKYN